VHINQVLVETYNPGKIPVISDGGKPNPANEICTTGTVATWNAQASYRYNYFIVSTVFGANGFQWAGTTPTYITYGPWGFIHPALTITIWGHKNCDRRPIDVIYPFMDWMSTLDCLDPANPDHAPMLAEATGTVRWQRLDTGLPTDRVVLAWCDVGQMEEKDTCNFRVVFNQSPNNTNPNDMRIEWVDVGSHLKEVVPTPFTGSFIIWKGVFIPIKCDNKWISGTSVIIDQP
jgi:hypothetical protein